MREGRGFKIFLYWIIIIGYVIGLFYVWHNFKAEMEEQQNLQKQYEMGR